MGQVTIYLDEQTETEMNAAIKASGISKSKWVANIIHEKAGSTWPESVTQLAAAWPDFPSAETIRESSPTDSHRESF